MALVSVRCAHCTIEARKETGAANRARRKGAPIYCGWECAGLARRAWKSPEQKIAEKAAYDAQRRRLLADEIRATKREYHKRTYDPVKAAVERKARMPHHVEYCRRPEYRAWKRQYDRQYRATKEYGDFADCFLLLTDIRAECLSQMTDYEIRLSKGTLNKRQQRKRDDERLRPLGQEPQGGSVGNLERGKGWQNGGLASGLRRLSSSRDSSHDQHPAAGSAAGQASGRNGRDRLRGELTTGNGGGGSA